MMTKIYRTSIPLLMVLFPVLSIALCNCVPVACYGPDICGQKEYEIAVHKNGVNISFSIDTPSEDESILLQDFAVVKMGENQKTEVYWSVRYDRKMSGNIIPILKVPFKYGEQIKNSYIGQEPKRLDHGRYMAHLYYFYINKGVYEYRRGFAIFSVD